MCEVGCGMCEVGCGMCEVGGTCVRWVWHV